jgi:hypothetical protein
MLLIRGLNLSNGTVIEAKMINGECTVLVNGKPLYELLSRAGHNFGVVSLDNE